MRTIFLLSPASCGGARAALLLEGRGRTPLARTLWTGGAVSLGDAFTFMSGLYFRGKRAYAERFARPPDRGPGVLVVTPSRGLLPVEAPVTLSALREFAATEVHAENSRYTKPLIASVRSLRSSLSDPFRPVLLGSIATDKYVAPLLEAFHGDLWFPADFVGRGDLSRGGLLLRRAREGRELGYLSAGGGARRGPRPPRLPRPRHARNSPTSD